MLKNLSRKQFFFQISHSVKRELMALSCVALVSTILLGCQNSGPAYWQNAPTDYRQRHPIVIGDGVENLTIQMHQGGFGRDQEAAIREFVKRYRRQGKGGIIALVTTPGSTMGTVRTVRIRKKGCRITRVRRRVGGGGARGYLMAVRAHLIRAGVPSHLLTVRQDNRSGQIGRVELKFFGTGARVATRCGLWPTDLAGAAASDSRGNYSIGLYMNQPYWNLGCATQSNLAVQVDNAYDFVQMRPETLGDSVKSLMTVQKYRAGESTAE